MNLGEYLSLKKDRIEQFEAEQRREHCLKCLRPSKNCYCSKLKPFNTRSHFCLLMHPKEAKKERVGTGRRAHLNLKNSSIIVDQTFDENKQVKSLLSSSVYFPMLLYPGETSLNISQTDISVHIPANKTPLFFILDGTWPCAKSMMRDSSCLHDLSRVSFDSKHQSHFKIKQQPSKFCLSTIESIYYLLQGLKQWRVEQLEGEEEILLDSLQDLVEFQIRCALDPNLQSYRKGRYRPPEERKESKRWQSRKICFES